MCRSISRVFLRMRALHLRSCVAGKVSYEDNWGIWWSATCAAGSGFQNIALMDSMVWKPRAEGIRSGGE